MFVSDLRHFLDMPDDAPAPAKRLGLQFAAIVRAASARPVGKVMLRRPDECVEVVVRRDPGRNGIENPECGEQRERLRRGVHEQAKWSVRAMTDDRE